MSFKNEAEMYNIIEEWLRDSKFQCKCVVQEYSFTALGRRWRADVVGRYDKEGVPQFVGVEAKDELTTASTAFRQAEAMKSFCSQVYVAFPLDEFVSDQDKANEVRKHLRRHNIGVILIARKKKPRIEERATPSEFELTVYNRATKDIEFGDVESNGLRDFGFLDKRTTTWEDKDTFKAAFIETTPRHVTYQDDQLQWNWYWHERNCWALMLEIADTRTSGELIRLWFGDLILVEKRLTLTSCLPFLKRGHEALAEAGTSLIRAFEESRYGWSRRGLVRNPTVEIALSSDSIVTLSAESFRSESTYVELYGFMDGLESMSKESANFIVSIGFDATMFYDAVQESVEDAFGALHRALGELSRYIEACSQIPKE